MRLAKLDHVFFQCHLWDSYQRRFERLSGSGLTIEDYPGRHARPDGSILMASGGDNDVYVFVQKSGQFLAGEYRPEHRTVNYNYKRENNIYLLLFSL